MPLAPHRYYQEIRYNNDIRSFIDLREAIAKSQKPVIFEGNVTIALQMVAEGNYLYSSDKYFARWAMYDQVALGFLSAQW